MLNRRQILELFAAVPLVGCAAASPGGPAARSAVAAADGRRDFDFFHGKWKTHNWRLARRLARNDDWLEFDHTGECWPAIGELGNADVCDMTFPDGTRVLGLTLRVFDPGTRNWSIYWVDSRNTSRLDPPVIGRFDGPRGLFVGDDTFDGRPIKFRFIWTNERPGLARWEQAFSEDGGATWETNWKMVHERIG